MTTSLEEREADRFTEHLWQYCEGQPGKFVIYACASIFGRVVAQQCDYDIEKVKVGIQGFVQLATMAVAEAIKKRSVQ